jgi:hypothetical protein
VSVRVAIRAEAKLKVKIAHLLLMLIHDCFLSILLVLLQPLLVLC